MSQFRPSLTPDLEISRAPRAGEISPLDDDRRIGAADSRHISALLHRPMRP